MGLSPFVTRFYLSCHLFRTWRQGLNSFLSLLSADGAQGPNIGLVLLGEDLHADDLEGTGVVAGEFALRH